MQTWANCISEARSGKKSGDFNRSEFQRDYDRIIFSSSFRRLQNKTQVFPLPGNTFVHNRLTHSLEVASVGRSLGSIAGKQLSELPEIVKGGRSEFYKYDLAYVVAAACLAHDVGNPPFGHSGEKAISAFFKNQADIKIGDRKLIEYFSEKEFADLLNFEGNANALHILTYPYAGKLSSGMQLTYTTLASILKYPCEAQAVNKEFKHKKKYGFFQLDTEKFIDIAAHTNMIKEDEGLISYKRHPFVYLVEAADDICYRIIDLEDAHRIGIIDFDTVEGLLILTIEELSSDSEKDLHKIKDSLVNVTDKNEIIAYLRAKAISLMIMAACKVFIDHKDEIIAGQWNDTLIDSVERKSSGLQKIKKLSIEKIYDHTSVINVELAGYKVLSEIIEIFITALLTQNKSNIQNKTLLLLPSQFRKDSSPYEQVINVVDFVAGMTDGYAIEMYRNFQGIEIARHN